MFTGFTDPELPPGSPDDAGGRFALKVRGEDRWVNPSDRCHVTFSLRADGDNPLYIRLTQEDGTLAWTSPIYVYR